MKKVILYPTDDLELGEEEDVIATLPEDLRPLPGIILLILHDETLGITQRALKALRDELAERIDHELLVFQVPSVNGSHCAIYGFFLVDKTSKQIVIIGDGFRGDNGGEGGKGHRAVQALLALYGLKPIEMMPEEAVLYRADVEVYRETVNKVLELAGEEKFRVPQENSPQYVDRCFSPWR